MIKYSRVATVDYHYLSLAGYQERVANLINTRLNYTLDPRTLCKIQTHLPVLFTSSEIGALGQVILL